MRNSEWLPSATEKLAKSGLKTARLDALALLEFCTQLPKSHLLAHPEMPLNKLMVQQLNKLVQQRAKHVPLAYLTGHKEFYGLDFVVNKHVLIPRPETEQIVSLAIKHAPKNGQMLDVGTGSGCVAIAVARNRPDLNITASDISSKALQVARQNAKSHHVSIQFVQSSLFLKISAKFDVITANLPYVSEKSITSPETAYEPKLALYSGNDGLDLYHKFFAQVGKHLNNRSQVIIEAETNQHQKLNNIAQKRFKLAESQGLALLYS